MFRRAAAAGLLAAATLSTPALADIKCPPGTYASPSPVTHPVTGESVMWCAISWPAP